MPPFDLDVQDAPFRDVQPRSPRAQLASVLHGLSDGEVELILALARRLELRHEIDQERRRR
jgi:hypothetical protein